ncbi:IS21 family transposase [Bifidobacterium callitrichos]|nr:IS21 family transposase [Bifidobacterium callitrichos]
MAVRRIKARLVLRLRDQGLSRRAIASSQGMSMHSVMSVFDEADRLGIGWTDVEGKTDDEVYALLFPGRGEQASVYEQPDWADVHRQLGRVGVTLKLLHAEYRDRCAAGGRPSMSYDRFCKRYAGYAARMGATSRVTHKAGMCVEVDWAGPAMRIVDPATGEASRAYLFVGVLPYSRYAYVEATGDMKEATWLKCHVNMFAFFGCAPSRIVCDNLKTGVVSHPRDGEVVLNEAYRAMAEHYSAAVIPGRVRSPRDKSSAENEVWQATKGVIGAMRDESFASLDELNGQVALWLAEHNKALFQKRDGSRASVFEAQERPMMTPLPAVPYEVCTWEGGRKVQSNCHVSYRSNWYSAPAGCIGRRVDLKVSDHMLEIWDGGTRVSTHRLFAPGTSNQWATNAGDVAGLVEWQPWDRARVMDWARRIGANTVIVIGNLFNESRTDDQAIDPALAILRLSRRYGAQRLENACDVARRCIGSPRYRHIRPLLDTGQDHMVEEGEELRIKLPGVQEADEQGYIRASGYWDRDRNEGERR